MRRLVGIASIFLVGTGAAAADPCIIVYDALNPTYAPDDTTITLAIDAFEAFIGNAGTCSPVVNAHGNVANNPDMFEVYRAEMQGDVLPTPDDSATVTVNSGGFTTTRTFVSGDNPVITYYAGKDAAGKISQDIRLEIANATDPGTTAQLDTIDYTLYATASRNEVTGSLHQVNLQAGGLVTHLDGMSGLLTEGNLSVEGDNEGGTFGALGSYNFGIQGRYNLADGFSLLGGVSIFDFSSTNATARGFSGALAARYVDPNGESMRLLAEGGVTANALSAVSFTRSYTYDLTGTPMSATATGNGNGSVLGVYGRAGVVWSVDDANEVVLSATLKQSMLGLTTYGETFDATTNPFAANMSGTTTVFTTAKTVADWTTELTANLDVTSSLGVGATFANGGTTANVLGGGAATGAAQSTIFAEYGLNLDYMPVENATINAFIHGTTGTGIGTHLQVGAGARMRF